MHNGGIPMIKDDKVPKSPGEDELKDMLAIERPSTNQRVRRVHDQVVYGAGGKT